MAFAPSSAKPWPFGLKGNWSPWIAVGCLIVLGCLQLIWPLPTLLWSITALLLGIITIRPYFALVLAIFFMSFRIINIIYIIPGLVLYSFNFFFLFIIFGLFSWCFSCLAGYAKPYQSTSLDLPLAIFWITGVISLSWSKYVYIAGFGIVLWHTLGYILFLFIVALNSTYKQIEKLFWLLFWWS